MTDQTTTRGNRAFVDIALDSIISFGLFLAPCLLSNAGLPASAVAAETPRLVTEKLKNQSISLDGDARDDHQRNGLPNVRLIAANQLPSAPVPDPPVAGEKPRETAPGKPAAGADDIDIATKREDSLLSDQIELQHLLKTLGEEHPNVRKVKDRIKLTQEWLAAHRKEQKRTLLIKVPGRDPKEIAKILTELYGDKVKVAVDEPTNSVLIALTGTKIGAEAQSLLADIEASAKRLETISVVVVRPNLAAQPPINAQSSVEPFPADDEDHALDRQARQLAMQLRSAKGQEQVKLRKDLDAITEKQFEHRQQRRKQEIESLTERVERLKATHARRQQHKSEVIERRVKELLDPNADLKWEESRPSEDAID